MTGEMHWIMTYSRPDPPGTAVRTVEGLTMPARGTTRQQLFRDIERKVCTLDDAAQPGDISVLFFAVEPNDLTTDEEKWGREHP
jgi:hypothetical protein